MTMFSLSSASSHWVQFSLFMRRAHVNLKVCVHLKSQKYTFLLLYVLRGGCIPQVTKTLRFSKTPLEEKKENFQIHCNHPGKKKGNILE